ncbi:ribonuclease 3-like protein 2 [Curcuma longa]|uniref:ribonuclease 3-like protein 2 n=1 Tax=Curcuma longa TaxID=136217 RepID=UPI003D9F1CDB
MHGNSAIDKELVRWGSGTQGSIIADGTSQDKKEGGMEESVLDFQDFISFTAPCNQFRSCLHGGKRKVGAFQSKSWNGPGRTRLKSGLSSCPVPSPFNLGSQVEPSSSRNGKVATELDIELRRKVAEIENILGYTFRDKSLLVEAITHGSYAGHPSYQRLEFVGDAVLGLAVSNYLYEKYPDIGSDDLTAIRRANVSNERLARVAVRLGLYRFLRRNSPGLDRLVSGFTDLETMEEDEEGEDYGMISFGGISYGGGILKARTVLADMVESIAAAIYRDCDSDLKLVWKIFSKILKPLITLETMKEHRVATLEMLCQKRGKTLAFRSSSCGSTCTVDVIVDGMVMGTGSDWQMKIAKLNAAGDALPKLSGVEAVSFEDDEDDDGQNLHKQRLYVTKGVGSKHYTKVISVFLFDFLFKFATNTFN